MMGGEHGRIASRFRDQSRELRKKAKQEMIGNRAEAGKAFINEAAALEQADELLAGKDEKVEDQDAKKPGAHRGRDRRRTRGRASLTISDRG